MSVHSYAKKFPQLLRMSNPRGQVELLETIGKGNYGYVYKGRLLTRDVITAVKVVMLKEDEIKETLLEMEILQACSHPNITSFMGCYLKGLDLWICMEYCGAGSLDTFYRKIKQGITEDEIACILYETLLALNYLHTEAALIHRDIKAGNLLLTDSGMVKLADFGVSAQLDRVGGTAHTFIGTPYWMAPEVIMTEDSSDVYTCKADIWSVGITAIEMAEKNPPLSDIHPMRALKLIPTSNIGLAKPKLFSKPFVDFVSACLVKNPLKRPTAAEILEHPFLINGKSLDRAALLTNLVQKMADAKASKVVNGAAPVSHDDEDEYKPQEAPQQAVAAAVTYATNIRKNPGQSFEFPMFSIPTSSFTNLFSSSQNVELQTVPFSDFPALVNKVQDKSLEVFDPAPLFAVNVEVHSCAVLDGKYLLFGADRGLFFIDIGANSKHPIPIFQNVRFRKLQIIPQLNCLIALSGRHDHVRQYKLSSIRKLIRYLLGDDPAVLAKLDTPRVNADQDAQSEASVDDEYRKARHANERSEETLVRNWSADYIKILGTREAKSFAIEETELSTFMLVMFKQDMVLFEWAKQPYTRFMKLKAFWLPETPKFASITQDGVDLVSIYLGYSREMNLVNVDDSKVRDVRVSKDFVRTNGSKDRWRSFVQIPMSDAILAEALRTNIKNLRTVNRKLAAVGGPAVKKGSLSSERYFLATFNRMTKVVDASGQPMAGSGVGGWRDGVVWNEAPVEMILRPFQHVIAVGLNTAEIVDWKSADLRQRLHIDSSGSLRVLSCLHGEMIIAIDKKRKGSSIYLLREKTASPRPSGALLMKIREEESSASAIPKSSPEKKLSDRPAARNLAPEAPTAISSTPKLQYASPGIRSPVIPHENYSDVSEVPSIMVPNLGHSDGTEEISDFRISPLNLSPGLELGVQRATTSPVEASIEISKVVEKVRATTIVPGDIQSQVSPQSAFAAPVEKTRSTTMAPGAIQTQVPPHSAYAVNARQFMPGSNVGYSARIMRPSERRSLTSSPADESARSETASQNFDRRPSNVSSVASQSNIAQPTSNQERGSVSAISEYLVYAPQPLANGGARPDRRNSEYSGAGAQYRPQNINMRPRPQYHSSNFRAPNPQLQRPAYYQQPPPAQYMNQARPMNQHPQMQRPAQYQARPIPYMNQPRPVPYMDPARPVQYMDQPRPVQNIDQPRPMYMSMDQPRPQYTQGRPPQGAGEPARLEYARPMIYRYSNDGPRPYRPDPRIQRPPGG